MNVMNRSFRQFGLLTTTVILIICVALITGSTFSLFTSGTDEEINVSAAQVKVSSVIKDLKTYSMGQANAGTTFANGGTATITTTDVIGEDGTKEVASGITLSKLTPGDRVEFTLDVFNHSNVNIAYQLWFYQVLDEFVKESGNESWLTITVTNQNNQEVDLTGNKTDYAFAEGLADDLIAEGEVIESFNVAIELDFNTPNEYQNKTAKVEFGLDAVQANVVTVKVANATHLKYALEHFGEAILVGDIDLSETINIPKNQEIKLNLNGHNINVYTENGVAIDSLGKLIVVDEPIDEVSLVASSDAVASTIRGIVINRGTLDVQGGKIEKILNEGIAQIKADVADLTNDGTATITGGNLGAVANNKTMTIDAATVATIDNAGTATVSNATVETIANEGTVTVTNVTANAITNEGDMDINSATVETIENAAGGQITITTATVETIVNDDESDIEIFGGAYGCDVSDYLKDEYTTIPDEEGNNVVVKREVISIGDVTYGSLREAVEAAGNNAVLTLIDNVTVNAMVTIPATKTLTIDLNGKSMSMAEEIVATNYIISNLGTLTIKDSVGGGSITARGVYNGYAADGSAVPTAKITVSGGTFNAMGTNGGAGIFNYGQATVNGGAFVSVGGYSLNNQPGATMTVAEGVTANNGICCSGATLTVNGGDLTGNRSGCHVIYAWNSTVTINGGNIYNNNSGNATVMVAGSSAAVINGGTFGIADGRVEGNGNTWTSCLLDTANTATLTVNGGTFNGGFRVQAGTTMTINGGFFNDVVGSGYGINGTLAVQGGTYTDAAIALTTNEYVKLPYERFMYEDGTVAKVLKQLAKIGNTIYYDIDEAIAAWTNGQTLTLVADVTLNDTVVFKSTEHHILNLSTYTLTAASDKNAFEIVAYGTGNAERTAITITADANNPGSIDAGKKAVIYYDYSKGTTTGNDRPIIDINGGVFYGSTNSFGNIAGIYVKGAAARQCATINISGGTFNCSINGVTKSKLLISGGTFNYSVGSQGDSTALRLISGGRFKTIGFMTADSNNTKFWIGTAMATSNVGVYIDDEGYIVIGGAVITEAGDRFVASASYSTGSSYLQYSSAKDNGLYYTSLQMAFSKSKNNVTVYVDTIDMTTLSYNGTINSTADTLTVTFAEGTTPTWTVTIGGAASTYTDVVVDGIVTRTYTAQ